MYQLTMTLDEAVLLAVLTDLAAAVITHNASRAERALFVASHAKRDVTSGLIQSLNKLQDTLVADVKQSDGN